MKLKANYVFTAVGFMELSAAFVTLSSCFLLVLESVFDPVNNATEDMHAFEMIKLHCTLNAHLH